jgi:hypothetical protein
MLPHDNRPRSRRLDTSGEAFLHNQDPEQRDAMVNFGIPPQPPAALSAPPTLETPQKSNLATRRIPELPSDHTSTVPDRILVGTAAPKVNVPAEAIYRLTAHATKSRTPCMCGFAVRRGRRAERKRQTAPPVAQPPSPATGSLAASGECSRQGDRLELDGRPNMTRSQAAASAARMGGQEPEPAQLVEIPEARP